MNLLKQLGLLLEAHGKIIELIKQKCRADLEIDICEALEKAGFIKYNPSLHHYEVSNA